MSTLMEYTVDSYKFEIMKIRDKKKIYIYLGICYSITILQYIYFMYT